MPMLEVIQGAQYCIKQRVSIRNKHHYQISNSSPQETVNLPKNNTANKWKAVRTHFKTKLCTKVSNSVKAFCCKRKRHKACLRYLDFICNIGKDSTCLQACCQTVERKRGWKKWKLFCIYITNLWKVFFFFLFLFLKKKKMLSYKLHKFQNGNWW